MHTQFSVQVVAQKFTRISLFNTNCLHRPTICNLCRCWSSWINGCPVHLMSSQDSKQMSGKAKMSDVLCFWVPESMTLDGIGTWPLVAFSESLHWAQQSWFNLAQLFAHYFNLKAPSIFMWFVALSILPYGIWRSGAANTCEGQLLGLYIVDFFLLSLHLTQLLEKPKFLCLKQFSVILKWDLVGI